MARIAIDLDDTMTHMVEKLVRVYNEEVKAAGFNDVLKLEDIKSWNIGDYVIPEFADKVNDYFKRDGWFADVMPRQDAIEVLQQLRQDNEVFVVTAYHPNACKDKYNMVTKHFPFIDGRNIIFCNHKYLIDADYIVDDGMHNLVNFKGQPIVFDKPWNRGCDKTNDGRQIPRVFNWYEVVRTISFLEEDNRIQYAM